MNKLARTDRQLARACAFVLGVAVAWAAGRYEHDVNVARPAVLDVASPRPSRGQGPAHRVVWMLVDGLRLDASRRMPAVNRLRAEGLDFAARAEFPGFSGPNFVAQASGIEPTAAGVLTNRYPKEVRLDSIFRRASLANLRTALSTTDGDVSLRGAYAAWIDEPRLNDPLDGVSAADLVVVHLAAPDDAAHDHGTRSNEYREAVAAADAFVGRVVPTLDPARDALVFSSDHGNLAQGGHGGTEPEAEMIPIVLWGAGVVPDGRRHAARGRDVGPTIASLLGIGPLGHATGRALVGEDERSARHRTLVRQVAEDAGRRPKHRLPIPVVAAVATLALLARRARFPWRAVVTAPAYALVVGGLLVASGMTSITCANVTPVFAIRLMTFITVAMLVQLVAGGRASLTPAALFTSLVVLVFTGASAFVPVGRDHGLMYFLPIPSLTAIAFVCLVTAAIGTPERDAGAVVDAQPGEAPEAAGVRWTAVVERAVPEADGARAPRHSRERGHVE